MAVGLIYRHTLIYESAMFVLYGRHYFSRYRAIADLVAPRTSVLDVCCGPAILYDRYLRHKPVDYLGLDINAGFIKRLIRRGGRGTVWDLRRDEPLPRADYVIMQASLYHFLPDPRPVLNRMVEAACNQVIIAEPVRNLAQTRWPALASFARVLTDAGTGRQPRRFTERSLDELLAGLSLPVRRAFLISGGREKIYVIDKDCRQAMSDASRQQKNFMSGTACSLAHS